MIEQWQYANVKGVSKHWQHLQKEEVKLYPPSMVMDLNLLLPNKKDTANLRYTKKRDILFLGQWVHFVLIERCSNQQKCHPKLSIYPDFYRSDPLQQRRPSAHPLMMLAMVTFWQPPDETAIAQAAGKTDSGRSTKTKRMWFSNVEDCKCNQGSGKHIYIHTALISLIYMIAHNIRAIWSYLTLNIINYPRWSPKYKQTP